MMLHKFIFFVLHLHQHCSVILVLTITIVIISANLFSSYRVNTYCYLLRYLCYYLDLEFISLILQKFFLCFTSAPASFILFYFGMNNTNSNRNCAIISYLAKRKNDFYLNFRAACHIIIGYLVGFQSLKSIKH